MKSIITYILFLLLSIPVYSNTIVYPAGSVIEINNGVQLSTNVLESNGQAIKNFRSPIDSIPTYVAIDVNGLNTNIISETNGTRQTFIVTNDTLFGFNRKSNITNDGIFDIWFIPHAGNITFDSTVDADSAATLTLTNNKPNRVKFYSLPYATNWYVKYIETLNETTVTGYEPPASEDSLTNQLIFYLKFEGSGIESTGNYELIGTNQPDQLVFQSGKIGQAADFTAPSSPDTKPPYATGLVYSNKNYGLTDLITSNSWTVSYWEYDEVKTGDNVDVIFSTGFKGTFTPGGKPYGLSFNAHLAPAVISMRFTSEEMYWHMSPTSQFIPSPNQLPSPSEWKHYLVTYTNGAMSVYVDGTLYYSKSPPTRVVQINPEYQLVMVGFYMEYNHWALNAWLDEFAVWNRVLTSEEISTLYNSGAGYGITGY